MKKVLKWIGIVFAILVVIGIFAEENHSSTESLQESAKNLLTERELEAIRILIEEDIKVGLNGGDSVILSEYIHISAPALYKAYSANEVRGDQLYKNNKIIINGTVESINSSLGDEPVINLKGGDMFSSILLYYKRGFKHLAGDVNKNQRIQLACIGNGIILGSPVLKNCVPLANIQEKEFNKKLKEVENYLKNRSNYSDDVAQIVAFIQEKGKETNDFEECDTINVNCLSNLLQ